MFESFKSYKKEDYAKAEIDAAVAQGDAGELGRKEYKLSKGIDGRTVRYEEESIWAFRERKAIKKLEDLKNKAHAEGLKLEAKHDKLMENLRRSQDELDQFRQNELGMSEDSEDDARAEG